MLNFKHKFTRQCVWRCQAESKIPN